MADTHILVIADTEEAARHLTGTVLPAGGYRASVPESLTTPTPCTAILVDVSQLRASPLSGLEVQRSLGNQAPALLSAPRITSEMAMRLFDLDIRGFIHKPVEDEAINEQVARFLSQITDRQTQLELQRHMQTSRDELARRLEEMQALSRVGRAITSLKDIDVILSRIVEAATYLTRADGGAAYLADLHPGEEPYGEAAAGGLTLKVVQGLEEAEQAAFADPAQAPSVMEAFQTGEPAAQRGGLLLPAGQGDEVHIKAALSAPIVLGGAPVGVLLVHTREGHAFEPADEGVMTTLADYAAIALSKVNAIAAAEGRIDEALVAAREVRLHAETLISPIDGIESNLDTLLGGGFGALSEPQQGAVARVRRAVDRLKEIVGFIQETLANFEG